MTLTRQRKIFLGLGASALVALGADRIFLGESLSGPETALAASIAISPQIDSSTVSDVDGLLQEDDPTAATSLANRLDRLAQRRPGLLNVGRDAFRPTTTWSGVDESGHGATTDVDSFREAHKLVALLPKHRRPCAMVNEMTVFVGQKVDGFTLVKVGGRSAVFEAAGRRVELQIGGSPGQP